MEIKVIFTGNTKDLERFTQELVADWNIISAKIVDLSGDNKGVEVLFEDEEMSSGDVLWLYLKSIKTEENNTIITNCANQKFIKYTEEYLEKYSDINIEVLPIISKNEEATYREKILQAVGVA